MSRYTRNRAYRHNRAAIRKWKYEQMSLPKNESEETEMPNNVIKRTAQQQIKFIDEVLRLRGEGLTFTAITEILGEEYNANIKDVQNAYYRNANKYGQRPQHHDHEAGDPEAVAARIATEEMEEELDEALRHPIACCWTNAAPTIDDSARKLSEGLTAALTETRTELEESNPGQDEIPEIIMQRSSKTRKTMIRCESDGVKIKIDVTNPKVLKGVMDELAMMLCAAAWGA